MNKGIENSFKTTKINNQFVLKERIGGGSFGQIYKGTFSNNQSCINIRL